MINILGTKYKVIYREYKQDPLLKKRSLIGYSDSTDKLICVGRIMTFPGYESENEEYCRKVEKSTLRHEIIHSFLSESGLGDSFLKPDCGWAKNEEMVDWFAIQFPKILEVMKSADAL